MAPRDRGKRQQVVDEDVVARLTGGQAAHGDIVTTLVEEQLRSERESERKNPIRPAEERRRPRQITVTFSSEEIPQDLRDLAVRWGLVVNDRRGERPLTSAVLEYLLAPQLKAAKAGRIPPPPSSIEADSWT
jgi:hypothetical protein